MAKRKKSEAPSDSGRGWMVPLVAWAFLAAKLVFWAWVYVSWPDAPWWLWVVAALSILAAALNT